MYKKEDQYWPHLNNNWNVFPNELDEDHMPRHAGQVTLFCELEYLLEIFHLFNTLAGYGKFFWPIKRLT